jgi:hypothetical protein
MGKCMTKSRGLLLAGASALAILAGAAEANAATVVFSFTGGLQTFIAPVTGTYEIDAFGASGGGNGNASGGLSAEVRTDVLLVKGGGLTILVGAQGGAATYSGGGGGGGSFIMFDGSFVLAAVGGGGGAFAPGGPGLAGSGGGFAGGSDGGVGGVNGSAAAVGPIDTRMAAAALGSTPALRGTGPTAPDIVAAPAALTGRAAPPAPAVTAAAGAGAGAALFWGT